MDDGYKTTKGIYLCTESYSLNDVEILCDVLYSKFGLECNPHKYREGFRIYIPSKSVGKLILMVKPHFIEHFYYKLTFEKECEHPP